MTLTVTYNNCCNDVTMTRNEPCCEVKAQINETEACCSPTEQRSEGEPCCAAAEDAEEGEACCTPGEPGCCTSDELESSSEGIKEQVRKKYAAVATSGDGCGCGCGDGCGCADETSFIGDAYDGAEGYQEDADLQLGCGIPTEVADLQEGHDVLDLGSGAGIDVFIARKSVGDSGTVTGLDFTPEMVELARKNADQFGYQNVRFLEGDIESMPFEDRSFDRIISNCVINLVPDKRRAFSEIFRVLRDGGSFAISDIVLEGELPPAIQNSAEMYAGCVSGAITKTEYLQVVSNLGFTDVQIRRERVIELSDEDLRGVASSDEIAVFRASQAAILSITLSGTRP